jgi:hypothetical protein
MTRAIRRYLLLIVVSVPIVRVPPRFATVSSYPASTRHMQIIHGLLFNILSLRQDHMVIIPFSSKTVDQN